MRSSSFETAECRRAGGEPGTPQPSIGRSGLKTVNRSKMPSSLIKRLTGITKTLYRVVIDHADRLHEGVADSGTNKVEAAFLQILAHGIGFRSAGGKPLS